MHRLDGSFRQMKSAEQARKRRQRRQRVVAGLALVLVGSIVAGAGLWWSRPSIPLEAELVATGDSAPMPGEPAYVPALVALEGDPLLITLGGEAGAGAVHKIEALPGLRAEGVAGPIGVLSQTMLSDSERFMATLPSSPEDFAFFQAQGASASPEPPTLASGPSSPAPADSGEGDAGWGDSAGAGEPALPAFERTRIEDTTSLARVVPQEERRARTGDVFVRALGNGELEGVLTANGVAAPQARLAAQAMQAGFGTSRLAAGAIVAMRMLRASASTGRAGGSLVQLSIFSAGLYTGTVAAGDDGRFVVAADPWVTEDLPHRFATPAEAGPARRYRLIDAVYSTAARNGVPPAVIGEAIMHLARRHDLNAFAQAGDRLVLAYAASPRDTEGGGGRVLLASIRGGDHAMDCYVYRPDPASPFACLSDQPATVRPGRLGDMVVPVDGVMTSTFGLRRHPILNTLRMHKGVDWAAPVGTPVVAAFAGTVAFAGDANDYGNLVRIDHGGGRSTRYAHLSRFASGLHAGQVVQAGETIGALGTSGLSTGPHLHFELYQGDTPVDPLGAETEVAQASDDDGAVSKLVETIIHVESGGRADARNPLSSATGLGQFIDKTWLRMISTYRPDLTGSMPRADLLALRSDPDLSREMVRNLARENEASLRAGGHAVTAGRLYLAHFLGPQGADTVLSAAADADLASLLGPSVVRANPFLDGQTAAYVIDWAERKMARPGGGRAAPAVVRQAPAASAVPAAFPAYRSAIDALVAAGVPAL